MRRIIGCLFALLVCIGFLVGCSEEDSYTYSKSSKKPTTQTTKTPTSPPATKRPTTPPATKAPTEPPATESVQDYVFCSVCQRHYENMDLINGVCKICREGACFLCGGPTGPDHNCNDYPNVICPNPECDWGTFTTGVGIDGIICPQCGTRCV